MNNIEDLAVSKENIFYGVKAENVDDVIDFLAEKLFENGYILDLEKFKLAVFEREGLMCTNIGSGFAIPHGKSSYVKKSTVAFATLEKDILWGEEEAGYVFLMAVNDLDKGDSHIKTLANLASKLMDEEFIDAIKKAKNSDELYKIINNI